MKSSKVKAHLSKTVIQTLKGLGITLEQFTEFWNKMNELEGTEHDISEFFVDPEWIKGFSVGKYQGYHAGIDDFKNGLRAIWKIDEHGNQYIVEKVHYVNPEELSIDRGKEDLALLTPLQAEKLKTHMENLMPKIMKKYPDVNERNPATAFIIPEGTQTHNWGLIKHTKLAVLRKPMSVAEIIPKNNILYFEDYDP